MTRSPETRVVVVQWNISRHSLPPRINHTLNHTTTSWALPFSPPRGIRSSTVRPLPLLTRPFVSGLPLFKHELPIAFWPLLSETPRTLGGKSGPPDTKRADRIDATEPISRFGLRLLSSHSQSSQNNRYCLNAHSRDCKVIAIIFW
ncbi:hypothetical protein J6590_029980 [Homalodisca vitripennis]|nr:hypothetical protein J6590_029980 [Homalodisca vitripennis]